MELPMARDRRRQNKIKSNRLQFRVPGRRPPKCQTVGSSWADRQMNAVSKQHPKKSREKVFIFLYCFVLF